MYGTSDEMSWDHLNASQYMLQTHRSWFAGLLRSVDAAYYTRSATVTY